MVSIDIIPMRKNKVELLIATILIVIFCQSQVLNYYIFYLYNIQ
jgi:hypothetical protein